LTANLLNEPYKIFVVDGDTFVREIEANSLSEAKKLGMNLLLEYDVNYKLSDVTMCHFKEGRGWVKMEIVFQKNMNLRKEIILRKEMKLW
jgi:hypothetical protein